MPSALLADTAPSARPDHLKAQALRLRLPKRRGIPTVNHQVAAFGLTCFEIVPYMPLAIFVLVVPVGALGLRYSVLRKTAGISIAWVLGASPPDLPLAIA